MRSISDSVSLSNTKTLRAMSVEVYRLGAQYAYRQRLRRAAFSLNEGFSVVEPISYGNLGSVGFRPGLGPF